LAYRRRAPTEIIAEILRAASGEGATLTRLVYRSNMNFNRVKKYTDLLVSRGLLARPDGTNGVYKTTSRGEEAIQALMNADQLIFGGDKPEASLLGFRDNGLDLQIPERHAVVNDAVMSFSKLRNICRHRDGEGCGLNEGTCKSEACPIVLASHASPLAP